MPEQAAIFADGRYTLQVRQQVDGSHWQYVPVPEVKMADWLADHAGKGTRIGYDPWLHTRRWDEEATHALDESGETLVAVESNQDDADRADRPLPSDAKLTVPPEAPVDNCWRQTRKEE